MSLSNCQYIYTDEGQISFFPQALTSAQFELIWSDGGQNLDPLPFPPFFIIGMEGYNCQKDKKKLILLDCPFK